MRKSICASPIRIDQDGFDGDAVKCVAVGKDHTLCLTEKGIVFAWGSADHGQLGTWLGRGIEQQWVKHPCRVSSFFEIHLTDGPDVVLFQKYKHDQVRVTQIAAGVDHSVCLTSEGRLTLKGLGCRLEHSIEHAAKTRADRTCNMEHALGMVLRCSRSVLA